MIRKILIACTMSGLLMTTAACATVKGAGKDIQSIGQAGEDAINGH